MDWCRLREDVVWGLELGRLGDEYWGTSTHNTAYFLQGGNLSEFYSLLAKHLLYGGIIFYTMKCIRFMSSIWCFDKCMYPV